MTPRLFAPPRRWAVLGLFAIAIGEAVSLAAAAAATSAVAAGLMSDAGDMVHVAGALAASACVAGFMWWRAVAAEDFGMRFVGEVRESLAHHAVETARAGRAQASLGVMSARMAGDLVAIKDWVSTGVSDGVAALAAALAGIAILACACGDIGLALAGAFTILAIVTLALAMPVLKRRWRRVRQERGRVAAMVGDITLSAAALGHLDGGGRTINRLHRRAQALRTASVAQRSSAALVQAPGAIATAMAFTIAILLQQFGWNGPNGVAGWTLLIFSVGLIGAALSGLARACDAYCAFHVADLRLKRLEFERDDAPSFAIAEAGDETVVEEGDNALSIVLEETERCIHLGDVLIVTHPDPMDAVARVHDLAVHDARTQFAGHALAQFSFRRRARRFPLVTPDIGLVRGSVRYNLSIHRRSVSLARMHKALALVGLAQHDWPLDRFVNPFDNSLNATEQARLRLARAICGAPHAIFIADPALMIAPDLEDMARRIAQATQAAVIVAMMRDGVAVSSAQTADAEAR